MGERILLGVGLLIVITQLSMPCFHAETACDSPVWFLLQHFLKIQHQSEQQARHSHNFVGMWRQALKPMVTVTSTSVCARTAATTSKVHPQVPSYQALLEQTPAKASATQTCVAECMQTACIRAARPPLQYCQHGLMKQPQVCVHGPQQQHRPKGPESQATRPLCHTTEPSWRPSPHAQRR